MTKAGPIEYQIRSPKDSDRSEWEVLWNEYLIFYESTIPQAHTDILWARILDEEHPIRGFVAERKVDSSLIGIVHFFPHLDTWEIRPVCYLQDLYVAKDARLNKVGSNLIRRVQEYSERQNWIFVYWQTRPDNHTARKLYDKLTGGTTGSITYQIGLRTK
ncbi:MAG: GNAT family N-acetyltransferase [Anaerolineales bacterium]|nr:GNAT family N-acetyltransferase [Anaerolineales bacterium]